MNEPAVFVVVFFAAFCYTSLLWERVFWVFFVQRKRNTLPFRETCAEKHRDVEQIHKHKGVRNEQTC